MPCPELAARSLRGWLVAATLGAAAFIAGCSGIPLGGGSGSSAPPAPATAIGAGQVKVALILPLTAPGNAGLAAQSMKNAAEMALAEFTSPNIQLLVKDDAGTAGAQAAAQQALDEGAEIILGPLFAASVGAAGQVARTKGVPVIAFSTDASVAARGVYLLSFLPESDVDRIVEYAVAQGKRSFAALVPENAYGSVVEAAFNQAVSRRGARIVVLERYPLDRQRMQDPVKRVAQAIGQIDAVFIPDGADAVPLVAQSLAANGVNRGKVQLLGTGLWDDPRIFAESSLQGGWFAAPEIAGVPQFHQPLSRPFRPGAGADRDLLLRRGVARRGAGQDARPAALLRAGADQRVRLLRASTACSASAPTARTSAVLRCCGSHPPAPTSSARRRRRSAGRGLKRFRPGRPRPCGHGRRMISCSARRFGFAGFPSGLLRRLRANSLCCFPGAADDDFGHLIRGEIAHRVASSICSHRTVSRTIRGPPSLRSAISVPLSSELLKISRVWTWHESRCARPVSAAARSDRVPSRHAGHRAPRSFCPHRSGHQSDDVFHA